MLAARAFWTIFKEIEPGLPDCEINMSYSELTSWKKIYGSKRPTGNLTLGIGCNKATGAILGVNLDVKPNRAVDNVAA
jgi:hypothetical protein